MQIETIGDTDEAVLGHLPVFRSGETVRYRDENMVVDYVIVRGHDLLVRLYAQNEPVRADRLKTPLVPVIWRKRRH
jgi:hypothetical protein